MVRAKKKAEHFCSALVVGLAGFEPAASSSRTKRATKLRYSPFGNVRQSTAMFVIYANRVVFGVSHWNQTDCVIRGSKERGRGS